MMNYFIFLYCWRNSTKEENLASNYISYSNLTNMQTLEWLSESSSWINASSIENISWSNSDEYFLIVNYLSNYSTFLLGKILLDLILEQIFTYLNSSMIDNIVHLILYSTLSPSAINSSFSLHILKISYNYSTVWSIPLFFIL